MKSLNKKVNFMKKTKVTNRNKRPSETKEERTSSTGQEDNLTGHTQKRKKQILVINIPLDKL